MPDLKHNFSRGRMNKDLDERLVPDGEYRDAENIEIVTSEGSNVGAAQNLLGTTWQKTKSINNAEAGVAATSWTTKFGYDTAKCVGHIVDNKNNSIYWFISATKSSDNPTNTSLILQYTDKYKIIRPVLVDKNGILNFTTSTKITGINVLPADGKGAEEDINNVMLFWTDNDTEPKKINVSIFMSGCHDMVTHTQYIGSKIDVLDPTDTTKHFTEENITVIKKSPISAPNMELYTSIRPPVNGVEAAGTGTNPVIVSNLAFAHSTTDGIVNFEDGSFHTVTFDRKPEWRDINRAVSSATFKGRTGDKIKFTLTNGSYDNDNEQYKPEIFARVVKMSASAGDPEVQIKIISIPLDYAEIIGTATQNWKAVLVERDPIYEFKFARFAYRWKYKDGEYSCYSPFTEVAFKPGAFDYDMENGYNLSMVNNLRRVELNNFTPKPIDVIEVEILCKESNSNLVYLVDTLKNDETSLEIDTDIISHVIDGNQLLRHWDNVPKKALAQEITGNRLVYGNYTQGYTIPKDQEPRIFADYQPSSITTLLTPEKSIKSIRDYQVGVVLKDTYGRETPVFTNSEIGINIPVTDSDKSNQIMARVATDLPSWVTHYKFFIKNPANEYYNLIMDRFYNAEDGNIWVSFPSAERNKVQEGDFLILKKQHNTDKAITSKKMRYKILDISNDVPEYVALKDTSVSQVKAKTLSGGTDKPVVDGIKFMFVGPSAVEHPEFAAAFKQGNKIELSDVNETYTSRKYEIEEGGLTGDVISGSGTYLSKYSVTLKEALDANDEGFANITFGSVSSFKINILQKEREILEEYIGRFFVKLRKDEDFIENVVDTMPSADVEYKIAHTQRFRDEAYKYADVEPAVGSQGRLTRYNSKHWAEQKKGEPKEFLSPAVFCWQDTHAYAKGIHTIPTTANIATEKTNCSPGTYLGVSTGVTKAPPEVGNNHMKFHISGYPGGDSREKMPDQHINTNGFTEALKKDAYIRFVVGLSDQDSDADGTNDVVYKSKIYKITECRTGAGTFVDEDDASKYIRDGVFKRAYRRGAPNSIGAAGTCPTRKALRQNWNSIQTWIVEFESIDGSDGFENMENINADGHAYWGNSAGDIAISPSTGKVTSGAGDGTKRNKLGPDFIEILKKETIDDHETQKSDNPGIWETEPKEEVDLDLYYEATDNIPVNIDTVTDEQYIEVDAEVIELNPNATSPQLPTVAGKLRKISAVNGTVITLDEKDTITDGTQLKLINKDGGAVSVTVVGNVDDSKTVNIKNKTVGEEIYFAYHNCYSYGNGVESNRIRDDFNQVMIDKGPKVSSTAILPYSEENRASGLIYSGIFNSTSGINETNQFIQGLKITKDLNPEYGSIQKLHTRNTDLITLCEDKVVRVLANKDALFNADGNINLTATENVLGQAVPYVGEFGISTNPESFADYAFRAYFTDKSRGAVLRLSRDGLTNIAEKGMTSYFGDNLPASNLILGSFDEDKQCYNLTHTSKTKGKDITVSFDERVDGWTSFKSFVPEQACSLNKMYYSFYNADMFSHDNTVRNKFYDVSAGQNDTTKDYETSITTVLNDAPSTIKQFKTLNYEGTKSREYTYAGTIGGASYTGLSVERLKELSPSSGKQDDNSDFTVTNTKGWYCNSITTNDQTGLVHEFKEKEGIWFNNIIGDTTSLTNLDTQEFSVQGIDNAASISGTRTHGNLTVKLALTTTDALDTAELQSATHTYHSTNTVSYTYSATLSGTRTLYITPKAGYTLALADFTAASNPTGVTNITLSQDGERIKAVITLGGSNFTGSGDQTITVNIGGLGVEKKYSITGTYDTEVNLVDDASGDAQTDQTNVAYDTTNSSGTFGEEKLIIDKSFYAKNDGSGNYSAYFEDAPYYQFMETTLGADNEPGERYRVDKTETKVDNKHVVTRFRVYYTFPAEDVPPVGSTEKIKFFARAVANYTPTVNITAWGWGSDVENTPSERVKKIGDSSRTVTVFGKEGAKLQLKQTDPDGNVTYIVGDEFTKATIDSTGRAIGKAPVTENLTSTTKEYTYEIISDDIADTFNQSNPFKAYQYGTSTQTFSASNASNTNLNISGATSVAITDQVFSTTGQNASISWTVTSSSPMILGTAPTVDTPLFTNLNTNGFDIEFNSITSTLNTAQTTLTIAASIDIVTHGNVNNTSVLDIGSYITMNTAPITAAQAITAPVGSATNVTLALTSASQTAQTSEGDTLVFSIVSNGSKGTAAVTNTATGAGTYTPTATLFPLTATSDSYTFKCNDGHQDSNTSTVSVTIPAVSGDMDSRLSERFTGSGGVGSGYYVHRTAYCDGTTLKGSGGCDLNNLANKFIRVIQAHGVANVNGCETWNASTTYHHIVKVGIIGSTSYGITTQAYQNDPGDSDGDGVSMFPGAYMVSNKHYPTYNDALNDTNGTTC